MRNFTLEATIGEESCCGVTIEDMKKVFQQMLQSEEGYVPSVHRESWLSEDFQSSNAWRILKEAMFFSAMIALRKANGLPVPDDFCYDEG